MLAIDGKYPGLDKQAHTPMSTSSPNDDLGNAGRKWGLGRKIAVGLGGVVALAVIAVLVVMRLTAPLTDVADSFFADLRNGAIDTAYARTSGPFRQATDMEAFRRFVARQHLDDVKSTSWGARKIEGARDGATGELRGTLTATDGSSRSLEITFVKEQGRWVIQLVHLAAVGADSGPGSSAVPQEGELVRMTHDAMMAFARSVKAKSMEEFHGVISQRWRQQQDVRALNQAFKSFIDTGIDLSGLHGLTPVFDAEPAVDDKGWLRVSGHYATTPSRVFFELGYIEEGVGWKLGAFKINVKPAGGAQP